MNNERIREFAIEARLIALEYSDCTHTTLSPQEQKFAELIWDEAYQQGYEAGLDQGYETYGVK